jgi:bifunctional hydroxylase/dehydrase
VARGRDTGAVVPLRAHEHEARFLCPRDAVSVRLFFPQAALRLAGLATSYATAVEGQSPLTGRRLPDLDLEGAAVESTYGLLSSAHFVLLDLRGEPLSPGAAGALGDRPDVVATSLSGGAPKEWADARAILVRPDGYVAWATDEPSRAHQAYEELDAWLARSDQSQLSEALARAPAG